MNEVWIAYNQVTEKQDSTIDWISEAAVIDEVTAVSDALKTLKISHHIEAVDSVPALVRRLGARLPVLVFNLCEGLAGSSRFEMHMAALWEMCGVPFTGNPAVTLALAQDKVLAKRLFEASGIPTPAWFVSPDGRLDEKLFSRAGLDFPLIAKPSREDASLGIGAEGVYADFASLRRAVERIHDAYRQPVLIERFIDGREFNVALVERNGVIEVLPITEILFDGLPPGRPRITSYEAKWLADSQEFKATPPKCPAELEESVVSGLAEIACKVFDILGGRDYGRIDLRMDRAGRPWVLEYNPNPDISRDAGFARAVSAAGWSYPDFIAAVVRNHIDLYEVVA